MLGLKHSITHALCNKLLIFLKKLEVSMISHVTITQKNVEGFRAMTSYSMFTYIDLMNNIWS